MNTRNKPCSCGSGKKSKKCCQSTERQMQIRREAEAAQLAAFEERERQREAAKDSRRNRPGNSILAAALMIGALSYSSNTFVIRRK